jgi:hypothetical protein
LRQCGGDTSVNVAAMAREMSRVLRPGGVFVMARPLLAQSQAHRNGLLLYLTQHAALCVAPDHVR